MLIIPDHVPPLWGGRREKGDKGSISSNKILLWECCLCLTFCLPCETAANHSHCIPVSWGEWERRHKPHTRTNKRYCAKLFYMPSSMSGWNVHFVITLNLDGHISVSCFYISIVITEVYLPCVQTRHMWECNSCSSTNSIAGCWFQICCYGCQSWTWSGGDVWRQKDHPWYPWGRDYFEHWMDDYSTNPSWGKDKVECLYRMDPEFDCFKLMCTISSKSVLVLCPWCSYHQSKTFVRAYRRPWW